MAREKFKKILEQLNNGSYKETSITIESYEDDEESLQDKIEDDEVILLGEALKKNPHVKQIHLLLQNIGDKGAKALAEVDTLEEVVLLCGEFGVSGASALVTSKLKSLCLEGGYIFYDKNDKRIERAEAELFIKYLIDNKTIERLDLLHTCIYEDLLIELIENTKSIKHLYLERGEFERELFKDLHISREEMHIYAGREEIILLGDEIQENNI